MRQSGGVKGNITQPSSLYYKQEISKQGPH